MGAFIPPPKQQGFQPHDAGFASDQPTRQAGDVDMARFFYPRDGRVASAIEPSGPQSPIPPLKTRLWLFPLCGLVVAAWFSLLAFGLRGRNLADFPISGTMLIALYFIGGLVGGLIFAMLFRGFRRLEGAVLIMSAAVLPLQLGVSWALGLSGRALWFAAGAGSVFYGVVWGAPLWLMEYAGQEPTWFRRLDEPDHRTVVSVWSIVAVVTVSSWITGLYWRGAWPATLAVVLLLGAWGIGVLVFLARLRVIRAGMDRGP